MCGKVVQSSALRYAIVDDMVAPTAACSTIRLSGTLRECLARFD
jgi:hypothetical protein